MSDVQIAVIDQQNTEVTVAVPGIQGPVGEGVPAGGTTNQVLFKQSGTDYDTTWGEVTSAMIGDLEIVNADVAAAAAIAGSKISPDFGAQNITTTGTSTAASFIPTSSSVPTNGIYLPSANTVALSTSGVERMRITNDGFILAGGTTVNAGISNSVNGVTIGASTTTGAGGYIACSRSGNTPLYVSRNTNDGNLVYFGQDGTQEGTISVSGTTVSYNGAHLSRWSQLPSGAECTEILRGTVLSNIDEMCEWGEEENEQLNRMKVSDVEGDKNVSGVFQAWDDDDDTYTNDFYCAMTGDFIIRIGAGVTVQRGDLLMSAGDGTAKPQDDDIIRSKTIAKVTSTTVSCTHPDGSYCVPCVLMAC